MSLSDCYKRTLSENELSSSLKNKKLYKPAVHRGNSTNQVVLRGWLFNFISRPHVVSKTGFLQCFPAKTI